MDYPTSVVWLVVWTHNIPGWMVSQSEVWRRKHLAEKRADELHAQGWYVGVVRMPIKDKEDLNP